MNRFKAREEEGSQSHTAPRRRGPELSRGTHPSGRSGECREEERKMSIRQDCMVCRHEGFHSPHKVGGKGICHGSQI